MLLRRDFLLVDDDADDGTLFCEALAQVGADIRCHTLENGRLVFEFLSAHGIPDVIFLDINMPVMNGWECLKMLKSSPVYKNIPTIMFSTSAARKDIDTAYSSGASLFLTKPEDFRELCSILKVVATVPEESLLDSLAGFESVKLN